MRTTIDRHERDVLWCDVTEFVLTVDWGDVTRSLDQGEGATARRLAQRFRDGMRLLDDLGWDRFDTRESYELTMPAEQLEPFLTNVRDQAEGCLRDEASSLDRGNYSDWPMTDEEWAEHVVNTRRLLDHDLDVRTVCVAVLGEEA